MLKKNFALFMLHHRFNPRDIFSSASVGFTHQEIELSGSFDGSQVFDWHISSEKLAELNRALAVAEYMSNNSINQPKELSRYTSTLSEEAWEFALRFAPYHKVHIALENLGRVHAAMLESCLSLNSAMAGMESAFDLYDSDRAAYRRERSRATSSLLTFSALYASYIEVCYRIRDYTGLKKSSPYSRSIKRIIHKRSGEHSFAKDLRNFILHYHLVEPDIEISLGEARSVRLLLKSNALLFSGFNWKRDAQNYIQANEKLDVMKAINTVIKDVGRVAKFHHKVAERFLPDEKFAYDVYTMERSRYHHIQKSAIYMGAAFKRPSSVTSRILDKEIIHQIINSSLTDSEIRYLMLNIADRHRNLSTATKEKVSREIDHILLTRPHLPNMGAFLNGREQN